MSKPTAPGNLRANASATGQPDVPETDDGDLLTHASPSASLAGAGADRMRRGPSASSRFASSAPDELLEPLDGARPRSSTSSGLCASEHAAAYAPSSRSFSDALCGARPYLPTSEQTSSSRCAPASSERLQARVVLPHRLVALRVGEDRDEAGAAEVEEPVLQAHREGALAHARRRTRCARRGRGAPRRGGGARRRRRRRSARSRGARRAGSPRPPRGSLASRRRRVRGAPGRCRTCRGACGASP